MDTNYPRQERINKFLVQLIAIWFSVLIGRTCLALFLELPDDIDIKQSRLSPGSPHSQLSLPSCSPSPPPRLRIDQHGHGGASGSPFVLVQAVTSDLLSTTSYRCHGDDLHPLSGTYICYQLNGWDPFLLGILQFCLGRT